MADDINAALGLTASPSASVEQIGGESSSDFIQRVRARTCYATLRGLITFFSVLSGIGVVISAFVCVVKGSTDQNGLLLFLGIGGGIFGVFIVIAYQQASSLLIDIADTLVEQNRKKSRSRDPSAS